MVQTEGEVNSLKSELQKLKSEEDDLQAEFIESQKELTTLSEYLQQTQIEKRQIAAMISQIEENKREMEEALNCCKTAIEHNDANVSDVMLSLEPDFKAAKRLLNATSKKNAEDAQSKPFETTGEFSSAEFDADFKASTFTDYGSSFGQSFSAQDNTFGSDYSKKLQVVLILFSTLNPALNLNNLKILQ